MKRMSVKAMQQANGGRWKCKYCNKKYLTWLGACAHQNSAHWYDVVMKGMKISWCW